MEFIKEKKHRLNSEVYTGSNIVSYTACVKNRKRLFVSDQVVNVFEEILLTELNANKCDAYIYLFMPEHLHFIIGGKIEDANTKICMDMFKKKTGFWLSKNMSSFKWQKDYYDHILQRQESLEIQIKYILMNPVRKGIVDHWKSYKFKGSTVYNLTEWD